MAGPGVRRATASKLLPVHPAGPPGNPARATSKVQAYNFRLCMTDRRTIRIPWPKPAGYDPTRYELLARYLQAARC